MDLPKTLIALLLTAAAFGGPVAGVANASHQCEGPAGAEIVTLRSDSLTVQIANQSASLDVPVGDAIVFSLDGGFWADVDYRCLEGLAVTVLKGGEVVSSEVYGKACGSGTHSEWVPMGLEVSEVTVSIFWWGCDGTSGGERRGGTAGDPPVFTPDGGLRL